MKRLFNAILILSILSFEFVNASRYKTVEYCIDGRVTSCFIGPYAYECTDTPTTCSNLSANADATQCFDPRVEYFQCQEGKNFVRWISGDCQNGLVTVAVCE